MPLARVIYAVESHACTEPGRVIVGGVLDVPRSTMFEKMAFLRQHADELREPPHYPAICCNLIPPPT